MRFKVKYRLKSSVKEIYCMNAREYLEILHVAERLKDTPRHCTTANRRTESVAEHSWRIALMAFLLRHEFPDLDIDKVVGMCLIHDLGECFTGDIPTFIKTDSDRNTEDALLHQVWLVGCDCDFHSVCPLMEKDKRLMEAS